MKDTPALPKGSQGLKRQTLSGIKSVSDSKLLLLQALGYFFPIPVFLFLQAARLPEHATRHFLTHLLHTSLAHHPKSCFPSHGLLYSINFPFSLWHLNSCDHNKQDTTYWYFGLQLRALKRKAEGQVLEKIL